ncbi:hypothetical protein GGX14DRAFT_554150 [Mycena pura]|uniref:Fido domain-containing protein n=1 Tax=Mycena pura TaxID=153505 RepID=A0AAD6YW91_9AGAR|nr:hypothetical protein GGX14DRAFT_554150 [Mycena pura]
MSTSRITKEFVRGLNAIAVRGIRNVVVVKPNELQSALSRPSMTQYYAPHLSTAPRLAAELAWGIILNHPFMDGNKRTAFLVANEYLREAGTPLVNVEPTQALSHIELIGQAHNDVAMGQMTVEQLAAVYQHILASGTGGAELGESTQQF